MHLREKTIVLVGYGTEGEHASIAALAQLLIDFDAIVHVVVAGGYQNLMKRMGVKKEHIHPYECSYEQIFRENPEWLANDKKVKIMGEATKGVSGFMEAVKSAVQVSGADAIVFGEVGAISIAESVLDLFPDLIAFVNFIKPMNAVSNFYGSQGNTMRWLLPKKWSHPILTNLVYLSFRGEINKVRHRWGLIKYNWWNLKNWFHPWYRGKHNHRLHVLHSVSSYLFEHTGLGATENVTGAWLHRHARDYILPEALQRFIDSDGRPIALLDMGSIPVVDPDGLTRKVMRACKKKGFKLIIAAGAAGLGKGVENSEDVFVLREFVHHSLLMQHITIAFHKCGAGITHRVCAAGVIHFAIPVLYDQPFYCRRLRQAGVLAGASSVRWLTEKKIEKALDRALNDKDLQRSAYLLGIKMRQENGARVAAGYISKVLQAA